jgi:proteasome accessory factor C
MSKRGSAAAQLSRILYLIPAAARSGGARIDELAEALGADPTDVLRDFEEIYTRAYYHPAGTGEDTQVLIEQARVSVWTSGEFQRPPRLHGAEALALGLGLRVMASEVPPEQKERLLAFAREMETSVSHLRAEDLQARFAVQDGPATKTRFAPLTEAAREGRRCRIGYLKPGREQPDEREIEPYVVLLADGKRYAVARCCRSDEMRVFRLDRMTAVEVQEERFTVPEGFDPDAYVTEGRVYRPGDEIEVRVRYSAKIARWIREKGPVDEEGEDGSVMLVHHVSDPEWIVRHVLKYGPDAEVLGPPEIRERVRGAAAWIRDRADPAVTGGR